MRPRRRRPGGAARARRGPTRPGGSRTWAGTVGLLYSPWAVALLESVEQALPEQRRDERGATGDPAPAGNPVTVGPGGPGQAGIQAVMLDLFAHLRRPLPDQPVIEVLVHQPAPLLFGRVLPGTEATVVPKRPTAYRPDGEFFSHPK